MQLISDAKDWRTFEDQEMGPLEVIDIVENDIMITAPAAKVFWTKNMFISDIVHLEDKANEERENLFAFSDAPGIANETVGRSLCDYGIRLQT